MRRETLFWLGAAGALVVFLSLEPYLSFSLFGSDSGEYYRLTSALVATGHLPTGGAYIGWGTAYPDFPGIFLLAGAGAESFGISTFDALTIIIPVVAALSFFPLFLLFRRLFPKDEVALLGAAFAAVMMPRVFSIAHPAPLALGDFLCVAALWMFVESRRDTRWYLPLSVTGAALIVTHHLSTFFFILSALGGLLLLELWRPGLWSRRFPTRELLFIGGLSTATLLYWFYGTHAFVATVLGPGLGGSALAGFLPLEAGAVLAVVLVGLIIRSRRGWSRPQRSWVRLPADRSLFRDLILLTVLIFGGIAIVVFVPLPGTSQLTTPAAIFWFTPVFIVGILTAGTRRTPTVSRMGPFSVTWTAALGIGCAVTLLATYLATSSSIVEAIPASRYVEYLLIPIGLMAAIGAARLVARAGDRGGRRALVAASVAILVVVAANAAIVYPPQADFGGFQEGYTVADSGLWMWAGTNGSGIPMNQVVASDHRLSSAIFGFDGNRATWGSTPSLFTGSNWTQAEAELESSPAPHTNYPVAYVVVDSVMYTGVALNPAGAALPLSPSAIQWFSGLPFVPVYENGQNVIYLVDSSTLSDG